MHGCISHGHIVSLNQHSMETCILTSAWYNACPSLWWMLIAVCRRAHCSLTGVVQQCASWFTLHYHWAVMYNWRFYYFSHTDQSPVMYCKIEKKRNSQFAREICSNKETNEAMLCVDCKPNLSIWHDKRQLTLCYLFIQFIKMQSKVNSF